MSTSGRRSARPRPTVPDLPSFRQPRTVGVMSISAGGTDISVRNPLNSKRSQELATAGLYSTSCCQDLIPEQNKNTPFAVNTANGLVVVAS